jgi:hypothetical protein
MYIHILKINLMNELPEINRVKKTRAFLLDTVKDLSIEKLNIVPPGFSNNIIWHLGHLIASQQGICYLRPGLPPVVEEYLVQLFKSGTKPERFFNAEEAETIKQTLFSSLDQLNTDLQHNLFANYTTWTTRYGVELKSIDDALQFMLFHEGLHSGYVTYMQRLI